MRKLLYPTVAEMDFVKSAIAAEALSDVDGKATDPIKSAGLALVLCPDNDHWDDTLTHLGIYLGCENIQPVPHLGGAMVLDHTLPLVREHPYLQPALYWQVHQAYYAKGIAGVYLMAHIPCGVAREHGIGPEEQVRALINGKRWIKSLPARPPHIRRIGVLLHFFDGSPVKPRRTYHMSTKRMEGFLAHRGYPISELLPVPA